MCKITLFCKIFAQKFAYVKENKYLCQKFKKITFLLII